MTRTPDVPHLAKIEVRLHRCGRRGLSYNEFANLIKALSETKAQASPTLDLGSYFLNQQVVPLNFISSTLQGPVMFIQLKLARALNLEEFHRVVQSETILLEMNDLCNSANVLRVFK